MNSTLPGLRVRHCRHRRSLRSRKAQGYPDSGYRSNGGRAGKEGKKRQAGPGEFSSARDLGLVAIHTRMPFQGCGQGRKLTTAMEKGPRLYCSPFIVEDLNSVISWPRFPLCAWEMPSFCLVSTAAVGRISSSNFSIGMLCKQQLGPAGREMMPTRKL